MDLKNPPPDMLRAADDWDPEMALRAFSRLIVMPAHNERDTIGDVIAQWAAFGQAPLVLVLDRCTDGTDEAVWHELRMQGFTKLDGVTKDRKPWGVWMDLRGIGGAGGWKRAIIINGRDHGLGKTGAVIQGLWAALRAGVSMRAACCLWDSDGEYLLSSAHDVWAAWEASKLESGSCMVVGVREGEKLLRSRLANAIIRLALAMRCGRQPPEDILTAVRVARMQDLLLWIQGCKGFGMETRIVREALRSGAAVRNVNVLYRPRLEGKKIGARHLPGLIWTAIA
jgi:hypothetical protein